MIKARLADEVLRMLSSFQYTKSEQLFERRDVYVHMSAAIGEAVDACFNQNYNLGAKGWIDPGFISTFEGLPVSLNTARNKYFCQLPALPMSLECGIGLYEVFPIEDQGSAYIPLASGGMGLFKGTIGESLLGDIGYRQEGRILFFENMDNTNAPSSIVVRMITGVDSLGDTDDIKLPENYQGFVIDKIIQKMAPAAAGRPDNVADANKTPNV